jgi:hypothetical protein
MMMIRILLIYSPFGRKETLLCYGLSADSAATAVGRPIGPLHKFYLLCYASFFLALKSELTTRYPQTFGDSKPRIWTTIWRENSAIRFEAKKAVKFTFQV